MRVDPNGDIHLHQSDLSTLLQCPEQFRLRQLVEVGTFESDAAYVGTVTHAVIEHDIENVFPSVSEAQQFGAETFLKGLEKFASTPGTVYSQETFGTHQKAMASLAVLIESWWNTSERDMLTHMHPGDYQTEWAFDIPFLVLPDGRTIHLAGTSDLLLPEHNQMWDWKTASGPYQKWEKQRWAIQPTVYLWAGAAAGHLQPSDAGLYRFDYKVLVRKAKPVPFETYTIYRSEANFQWLADQVRRQIRFMDKMGFEEGWPTADNHVLCSPRWCPFFGNTCKGTFVDGQTWT